MFDLSVMFSMVGGTICFFGLISIVTGDWDGGHFVPNFMTPASAIIGAMIALVAIYKFDIVISDDNSSAGIWMFMLMTIGFSALPTGVNVSQKLIKVIRK